jgi:hypothetical protein
VQKSNVGVAACLVALLAGACGGDDGGVKAPSSLATTAPAPSPAPASRDMPVFLLAGQSNMQGHVSAELFGELLAELTPAPAPGLEQRLVGHLRNWYLHTNDGYASYGYSEPMAAFQASELVRLRADGLVGSALTQPHPTVMCATNNSAVAALATQCGSPFGPELVLGHALAKTLATPTSLIKVALGGSTLHVDWRSPGAGEPVGDQYKLLRARIQSLRQSPASVHPDCAARRCQWAAFVWFQGENDTFDMNHARAYEQNLRRLIADVRAEAAAPALPVVIVQIGSWAQSMPHGRTVAEAQQTVARGDRRTRLVNTSDLSGFYHYDPAAQLLIGERVAKAVQELLATTP